MLADEPAWRLTLPLREARGRAGATVLTTARSAPEEQLPGAPFIQADASTPEGAETIAGYALEQY